LAKDSTKQLFDKDYNWLCVILGGLMQAKIRNEMIEGVSFFDSLSIWSPRDWYARNLGKIDFPPQFVLFFHLQEELATKR